MLLGLEVEIYRFCVDAGILGYVLGCCSGEITERDQDWLAVGVFPERRKHAHHQPPREERPSETIL